MYEDVEKVDRTMADLSELLRNSLADDQAVTYTLHSELNLIQLYVKIMRQRFPDTLHIEMKIDEDVSDCLVPRFILQPLIENAIKHCQAENNDTNIRIQATSEQKMLKISIEDNGPGTVLGSEQLFQEGVGLPIRGNG